MDINKFYKKILSHHKKKKLIKLVKSFKYKYSLVLIILISIIFSAVFLYIGNKKDNFKASKLYSRDYLKAKYSGSIKEKELRFVNSFDMVNDTSITKFVNNKVNFNKDGCIPEGLNWLSSKYVIDYTSYGVLREDAIKPLHKMGIAFFKEFKSKLFVVSAYRSYDYQQGIKDRGCPDNLCAKAGYSEHQSGLAVDFFSASTEYHWLTDPLLSAYYEWFKENSHIYGFTQTYQKGIDIDGYDVEPWHYRYVGIDLATYLFENEITLAEFYYKYHAKKSKDN